MSAQGGDPEAMSVSQYLDLAYAVVVEDRVQRGMTLFDALDDTSEWAARGSGLGTVAASTTTPKRAAAPPPPPTGGVGGPGAPVTATDLANQAAMATLQAALSGTGGVK